jgi:hypothetical protein
MNEYTDCVTIGGIWISSVNVPFKKLGVLFFDVLRGDDDFDLSKSWITVWLAN